MIFKSFKINNFRGFKDLEIHDLRRVNLIVGKNSVGKTTLLESIFLLSGRRNPICAINVENLRQRIVTRDNDFEYLYKDFSFDNNIFLSGKLADNNSTMNLTIEPIWKVSVKHENSNQYNVVTQQIEQKNIILEQQNNDIIGIRYSFKDLNGQNFRLDLSINTPPPFQYPVEFRTHYINSQNIFSVQNFFEKIIQEKGEQEIVSVLNNIDNRIQDLRMGANNAIFVYVKGISKAVPINIMGDGIRKIVSILSVIADAKNGIVLIDEIENGLHYTTLKGMWKAIFLAAEKHNTQLFITTHSKECIDFLIEFIKESNDNIQYKKYLSLLRLNNKNNEHFVTNYLDENLDAIYEKNLETR